MLSIDKRVKEIEGLDPQSLDDEILKATQPLLLKGLVSNWPMVRAGRESPTAADAYMRRFYRGDTVMAGVGKPEIGGRLFYNDDLTDFNFLAIHTKLDVILDQIRERQNDENPPLIYMGSMPVDDCLPGFRAENDIPSLTSRDPVMSIWIGNRSRIAAHFDTPDNLACLVAGRRRFTVFPPEQIGNLYIGPLDLTPAGQPISLVDFENPDFSKFPKFEEALKHAQVAEMEPGDAIFIPSSWWHHVEAFESLNVLVNYWWRQVPDYIDRPVNALMMAIMTIRDLPPAERKAWQEFFRHYVFEADENTAAHIPEQARRSLAPMSPEMVREMRGQLLKRLNR